MNSSAEKLALKVKAIILDVDGVLTDGGLIYGPEGESKIFNVRDGHGITLAHQAGIRLAIISGRESDAVKRRAAELKIDVLREKVAHKGVALYEVLRALDVKADQVCYAGDDLVDLSIMMQVGFPVTVADAVDEVKKAAAWVARSRGGQGAVREIVEFILKAKGLWGDIVQRHIQER